MRGAKPREAQQSICRGQRRCIVVMFTENEASVAGADAYVIRDQRVQEREVRSRTRRNSLKRAAALDGGPRPGFSQVSSVLMHGAIPATR